VHDTHALISIISSSLDSHSHGPTPEEYESLTSTLQHEKQQHQRTIITLQQTQAQCTTLQQQMEIMRRDGGMHIQTEQEQEQTRVQELEKEVEQLKQALQQARMDAVTAATAVSSIADLTPAATTNDEAQEHIAHLQVNTTCVS
jgi:chromosome segregation ATPase